MNKDRISDYKRRLEQGIEEYMSMPISQRSAEAVDAMIKSLNRVNELCEYAFTEADARKWCDLMVNEDGTVGGHWSIADTSALGIPAGVTDYEWNCAMNMLYSDYCKVFQEYGVGTPQFYSDVARAFLHDKDAPKDKIGKYYNAMTDNA